MEQGLTNGRPSIRLSHRSTATAAGLLLSAVRAGDRSTAPGAQQQRHSAANAPVCGQWHVNSRGSRLNTDLLEVVFMYILNALMISLRVVII